MQRAGSADTNVEGCDEHEEDDEITDPVWSPGDVHGISDGKHQCDGANRPSKLIPAPRTSPARTVITAKKALVIAMIFSICESLILAP